SAREHQRQVNAEVTRGDQNHVVVGLSSAQGPEQTGSPKVFQVLEFRRGRVIRMQDYRRRRAALSAAGRSAWPTQSRGGTAQNDQSSTSRPTSRTGPGAEVMRLLLSSSDLAGGWRGFDVGGRDDVVDVGEELAGDVALEASDDLLFAA